MDWLRQLGHEVQDAQRSGRAIDYIEYGNMKYLLIFDKSAPGFALRSDLPGDAIAALWGTKARRVEAGSYVQVVYRR